MLYCHSLNVHKHTPLATVRKIPDTQRVPLPGPSYRKRNHQNIPPNLMRLFLYVGHSCTLSPKSKFWLNKLWKHHTTTTLEKMSFVMFPNTFVENKLYIILLYFRHTLNKLRECITHPRSWNTYSIWGWNFSQLRSSTGSCFNIDALFPWQNFMPFSDRDRSLKQIRT
jgi:hypothetical protein